MNVLILLATSLLFQASSSKPLIDNARVSVWEGHAPAGPLVFDTLTVSSTGSVKYFLKGSPSVDEKLIIGFKPVPVIPLANKSGFPLAMPRPGGKKVFDNSRITVWDYRWTPGIPTPMHFHDKDVVVMFLEDGDLKSTASSGEVTLNQYKAGTIRFNARDRVHTEELTRGTERAIIVELK